MPPFICQVYIKHQSIPRAEREASAWGPYQNVIKGSFTCNNKHRYESANGNIGHYNVSEHFINEDCCYTVPV